jgi:hypothetical protein
METMKISSGFQTQVLKKRSRVFSLLRQRGSDQDVVDEPIVVMEVSHVNLVLCVALTISCDPVRLELSLWIWSMPSFSRAKAWN